MRLVLGVGILAVLWRRLRRSDARGELEGPAPAEGRTDAPEAAETSGRKAFEEAADRVRDTAKWILASFGAIAAALIVGIQFSDLGTLSGSRVVVALLALALAFVGIVVAIRAVSALLLPTSLTMTNLAKRENSGIVARLQESPELLHPYPSLADLQAEFQRADKRATAARAAWAKSRTDRARREMVAAEAELESVRRSGRQALLWARHFSIELAFARLINRRVLPALSLALIGLVLFVFSIKQPPDAPASLQLRNATLRNAALVGASLRGVDLRDADLRDARFEHVDLSGATLDRADLRGASFNGANLSGARLDGALLEGATWAATTCPDGTRSDDAGDSCVAHLVPPPSG